MRLLSILFFLPTILHAADAVPPAQSSTVIVTAAREEQPLLEYPGNLARIEGDELRLLGATHHSEALNRTAGVMIQRGSGQESLTALRSPVLTGAGSCGAFLFLEEGIPIRPIGSCNVNDLFEVNTEQAAAVEVLRGPGPALYGSGAVHGIINVLMPDPQRLPRFSSSIEAGADDYRRARVAAAGSDVGVMGQWTHDGGFRTDSGFEEQKLSAVMERDIGAGKLRTWITATNLNQDTAGFIEGYEAYRDSALRTSNSDPEAYRDANSARLGMYWQQPVGERNRLHLRAMARHSRMDFLQHFLLGKPLERNGQDSATALLAMDTAVGNAQLTTGLDVEAARSSLLESQPGPTLDGAPAANAIRPAGRHYDYDVNSRAAALYAQWAQPLTETIKATLGLRAEYVNYDYNNRLIAGNTDENGVPCPGGCLYNRPADRKDDFTNLTPKLALLWAYAPSQRLYFNAARGYRAPEATELYRLQRQQTAAELSSESSDSLELGARGEWSNVSYSLAAFHMDKRHAIFRDAQGFNISDGHTRHRGVEYELNWRATQTLTLSTAGTVARHTYEFDRVLDGAERIVSGKDVDTAPRHLFNVRAQWAPIPQLRTELEWLHVGSYFLDAANEHSYGGHDLLNLRLGWEVTQQWQLSARVANLLQTSYADRADFAFGNYRYFPGRDRTAFIELAYRWDRPGATR